MATKADLIEAVLQDLGVLQAGQAPEASDATLVSKRLDRALADLATRNVIYIPGDDEFDEQVTQHLTDILVELCAPAFGQARDASVVASAEARLRTIQRIGKGVSGARLKVDRALLFGNRSRGRL